MRPESESMRLFGITRAKGKMYELGIPESRHLQVDPSIQPESVLLLAVGTIGDIAVQIAENVENPDIDQTDLDFAASYFDALLSSHFEDSLAGDVTLLATSAYYLAGRPGSSRVMADRLSRYIPESPTENALRWILGANQDEWLDVYGPHKDDAAVVVRATDKHFREGSDHEAALDAARALRRATYASASARDLLFADLILAVLQLKFRASSWLMLPTFSKITASEWRRAIVKPRFPKELWPAQLAIGRNGLFAGRSGVVQMPTSAGKTRSLEMVLRSGSLSGRARLAVIVAPFRALSHEIATSMREAFRSETDVSINELSDALQDDFGRELSSLLGTPDNNLNELSVLVLTPEKFQFVVRQRPDLIDQIDMLVYDEAHQFDSGTRGVTYELLMTEVRAGLPRDAQVIAISAVMRNADELSNWLLPSAGEVVDGRGLSPTARAVAFATWLEQRGQLRFFETSVDGSPDYFVPRVIVQQRLELRGRERKERNFPERDGENLVTDVALYLGLRVFPEGSVAIFAGTKATANKIANRAVDVFGRGLSMGAPASHSDPAELARLNALVDMHFGEDSKQSRAARLGVFVHHRNTPNGMRLAIEHAMQQEMIRLVVCTSTLAQGVNLPIRYLILTGTQQAQRVIGVRDFQNLLGRAGRAGMHTEGLVIFADPRTYDRRRYEEWRFAQSVHLLNPENAEATSSSILSVVRPFDYMQDSDPLSPIEMVDLVFAEDSVTQSWASELPLLVRELEYRRSLLTALESYLMANRNATSLDDFRTEASAFCEETFAFAIASEDERIALRVLFIRLAESVSALVADPERQGLYGQTLLSAGRADLVYKWVDTNRTRLLFALTNDELLDELWPLLAMTFESALAKEMAPANATYDLAKAWLAGESYGDIFERARTGAFSKPFGLDGRRRLSEDDLFDFLNSTLAFETSLIIAAVCQFLGSDVAGEASPLGVFLKCMKYGVSTALQTSAYEMGFADRALAILLAEQLVAAGNQGDDIREAVAEYPRVASAMIAEMPDYFSVVMQSHSSSEGTDAEYGDM